MNSDSSPQQLRRRDRLVRSVGLVTQVSTVAALTSTGALVGFLGHQAQVSDALKAQAHAVPATPAVVVVPVQRPLVVVRVQGHAATSRVVRYSSAPPSQAQPPPMARAPRPTTARAATTSSGSAPR